MFSRDGKHSRNSTSPGSVHSTLELCHVSQHRLAYAIWALAAAILAILNVSWSVVQVDTYCEQLNRLAAQSLERLYVVDSLQRACGLGAPA